MSNSGTYLDEFDGSCGEAQNGGLIDYKSLIIKMVILCLGIIIGRFILK